MMFAKNNFRIDAQVAGLAKDLDYPADWRDSAFRKAHQLHVYDCAVELFDSACTTRAGGLFRIVHAEFYAQRRCQFFTRRNFNLMLNACVVREDHISARPIAEEPHNGRMGAVKHSHNPALRSLSGRARSDAPKIDQHMVTVHGVADSISWDKNVAIQLRHRLVRNHKAVPVLVEDQPA